MHLKLFYLYQQSTALTDTGWDLFVTAVITVHMNRHHKKISSKRLENHQNPTLV